MSDLDQRMVALRTEIDRLKAALQTTTHEAERAALHMRLNDCIRASLRLIDERLLAYNAYLREKQHRTSEPLRERSVGEKHRS
jgi:hypothetical protein